MFSDKRKMATHYELLYIIDYKHIPNLTLITRY